jgi:hypothetical protein
MKNYSYDRSAPDYSAKVEYYQATLSNAVDALDIDKIKFLTGKLEYFVNRQKAVTGMSNLESLIS